MTGKRFTWNNHTIAIEDNQNRKHYYTDITCIDELVELLNMLHEENQALKSDRERYEEECRLDMFRELYEENEQLKHQIETYKSANTLLKKTLDGELKNE